MRKKKTPTRKRQALRWLCAAVLLILMNNISHRTYYLLPSLCLWENEEIIGCGRTTVLRRTWDPAVKDLIYLSANDKVVILLGESPGLSGWNMDNTEYLDYTKEENALGSICVFYENTNASVWYAYGRVDDPSVAEMRLSVQFAVMDTDAPGCQELKTSVVSTAADDWIWQDGKRYFLLRNEPEGPVEGRITYPGGTTLTALDADEKIIAEIRN